MTLIQAIADARSWARVNTSSHSDQEVMRALNDGQREFAKEAHGLTKEGYLDIEPVFDTRTNFAVRITITAGDNALVATDVVLTGTDRDNVTGTQVATDLQVTLRAAGAATATVVWSTTTWVFTIDSDNGTDITIGAPSAIIYADATGLLFGAATGSSGAATYVGSLPEDCTVEADLPSDCRSVLPPVEWDGNRLTSANFDIFASPGYNTTTPYHYALRGTKMRLWPAPSRQGLCHFWYEYIPAEFANGYQGCSLSGLFDGTASGLANTTAYYFKVTIDGGTVVEFTITTVTDTTYEDIIDLMNAASIGCTWSLEAGNLRCTSDTLAGSSSIALAAGTTGADLFGALTGWTEFDTAVAGAGTDSITIPSPYEQAPVYFAASVLAEQQHDYDVADRMFAQYRKIVSDYTITKNNQSPKMGRRTPMPPMYQVIP